MTLNIWIKKLIKFFISSSLNSPKIYNKHNKTVPKSYRIKMICYEKRFDQDGQYNRQNVCVCAESREAANKYFVAIKPVYKFPFKVWFEITFIELQRL